MTATSTQASHLSLTHLVAGGLVAASMAYSIPGLQPHMADPSIALQAGAAYGLFATLLTQIGASETGLVTLKGMRRIGAPGLLAGTAVGAVAALATGSLFPAMAAAT